MATVLLKSRVLYGKVYLWIAFLHSLVLAQGIDVSVSFTANRSHLTSAELRP